MSDMTGLTLKPETLSIGKVIGTVRITAKMRDEYDWCEWRETPDRQGGVIIDLIGYKRIVTPVADAPGGGSR